MRCPKRQLVPFGSRGAVLASYMNILSASCYFSNLLDRRGVSCLLVTPSEFTIMTHLLLMNRSTSSSRYITFEPTRTNGRLYRRVQRHTARVPMLTPSLSLVWSGVRSRVFTV